MNKSETYKATATQAGVDQSTAANVLDSFFDVLVAKVADGEKIQFPGLLTFERVHKAAGTARNPATGETIDVAAKDVPKVSVGATFKKIVKGDAPKPSLKPGI